MIIIPALDPTKTSNPELLPIAICLENRLDVLKVILRVLRYMGSVGVWGDNLRWEDSKDSPLYIDKYYTTDKQIVNPCPAILASIGGYKMSSQYLNNDSSMVTATQTTKVKARYIPLNIIVRGASEYQGYMLADRTAEFLEELKRPICGAVTNLDHLTDISVGSVEKTRDNSGNPYIWECHINLSAYVMHFITKEAYKDFPIPGINTGKGVHLGLNGPIKKVKLEKNIFTLGVFQEYLSPNEESGSPITRMVNIGIEPEDTSEKIDTTVFTANITNSELLINVTAGRAEFEIDASSVTVNLPGFARFYKENKARIFISS